MVRQKTGVRYPWDEWFKMSSFTIRRNVQFFCQPHGMSQQIRNAAVTRGKHVTIKIDGDSLTVTVKEQ